MLSKGIGAFAFLAAFTASAQAATVCAWMIEANQPDQVREVDIWLQSDQDVSFLYKVGGKGNYHGFRSHELAGKRDIQPQSRQSGKALGFRRDTGFRRQDRREHGIAQDARHGDVRRADAGSCSIRVSTRRAGNGKEAARDARKKAMHRARFELTALTYLSKPFSTDLAARGGTYFSL